MIFEQVSGYNIGDIKSGNVADGILSNYCEVKMSKDTKNEEFEKVDDINETSENPRQGEIKKLEQDIDNLKNGWQRTQADFSNFKKQVERDRACLIQTAKAGLVGSILPVFDNFELAAKHVPEDLKNNNWAIGITLIEKQLFDVLSAEGLEKIASLGQHFDPELHETVDKIASSKQEGEIVEEIASGYKFNGVVLRPAKVKISSGKKK